MKKLVFALFLALQAPAYSPNEIVNAIAAVAQNEGVKPEILYTIVKIESDFEPYTISFLTNKANADYFAGLRNQNIRIKTSNYRLNSSKWVVTIIPANEIYAVQIANELYEDGISIDVALHQTNAANISPIELD